ncbi:photosynthetic complex putative assembly protein PuhB [Lamprobacter modestohalophilus]|uniref:photosynthetic complex putative assembly protein PuhB n=1 Tax=Lamprobacter modestohalophilus TaxID=1064514 RepID=UPI002ADEAF58|nr:photosynthetic complex putative assembly protein PuhB [Lamprobacter modestohalophilus]MEA1049381.1 photosynthetic complex putative assembly protein PuhB [Lamprobacter modestohalophilus]
MSEFAFEPIHGLPENLPPGEALRWQGAPHWRVLARRAFYVRSVAFYFGVLIVLRVVFLLVGGAPAPTVILSALWLATLGLLATGILTLLAMLYSRSTVYSITDYRVVIRFGVALPMAVNIPFKIVESAGLRTYPDGSGDIPLVLSKGQNVSYLIMWPNVRPWQFTNAQPMLRSIPEAAKVADILAEALRSATAEMAAEAEAVTEQAVDADREDSAPASEPSLEPSAAKAGGQ